MAAARKSAQVAVSSAKSENEVRRLVQASSTQPFVEQRALREEAAVRLAAPDIQNRIEHTLKPYAHLLDPNPRAMKLFVNAYSANRALAILSEEEIELHQLALWTIICSRWPKLADYLALHPEMLEKVGLQGKDGFPDELELLSEESAVVEVIKGNSTQTPLNIETLKQCARMRG